MDLLKNLEGNWNNLSFEPKLEVVQRLSRIDGIFLKELDQVGLASKNSHQVNKVSLVNLENNIRNMYARENLDIGCSELDRSIAIVKKVQEKLLTELQKGQMQESNYSDKKPNEPILTHRINDSNSSFNLIPSKSREGSNKGSPFIRRPNNDMQVEEERTKTNRIGNPIVNPIVNEASSVNSFNSIPPVSYQKPEFNYEFLFTLSNAANKSDVFLIDKSTGGLKSIQSVKISKFSFKDIDDKSINDFPPSNCKFVNIGGALLVTGGLEQQKPMSKCYILLVEKDKNGQYSCIIKPYAPMIDKRERHNLIYLPDKKMVMACSGFFTSTCEVTEIDKESKWTMKPTLNQSRANATMFYINNKYIFCLSGFTVIRDKGNYLNSLEYIDLMNDDKWTVMDLASLKSNLKLSAIGVIQERENKVLLLGGYDGEKYVNSIYSVEVNMENKGSPLMDIIQLEQSLPKGMIFKAPFVRMGSFHLNFEYYSKTLVAYDWEKKNFEFIDNKKLDNK
jgi:hypothetical protein